MQLLKHLNKWLALILVISFSTSVQAQNLVGQKAPSLVLENQQGNKVKLLDLQGKYVLLNFWASWCPESVIRLPDINKIKQDNSNANMGFEVFNVALDEDVNVWLQTCHDNNLSGEYQCVSMGRYDSYCAIDFGISKLPTYFLISPDGTIVEQDASFEQIESYLTTGSTISEHANVDYKVLLGHFGSLHYHNAFSHLSHLGPLGADMFSENDYLVWIGPFTDYSSAQYAEQQAKKMGYLEAQNIPFKNSTPIKNSFTTPNVQTDIASNATNGKTVAYTPSHYVPTPTQRNTNNVVFTPPISVTQSPMAKHEIVQAPPTQNATKTPDFAIQSSSNKQINHELATYPEPQIPAAPWEKKEMPVPVPTTIPVPKQAKKEEDTSIETPTYVPVDNTQSQTYIAIANNPRIQNRINRLEKKKKHHDSKANKIDTKIRDIEQDAVMKSVYGKSRR